jgi:hypothetical protein
MLQRVFIVLAVLGGTALLGLSWQWLWDWGNRGVHPSGLWYALVGLEAGLTICVIATAVLSRIPRLDEVLAIAIWGHVLANTSLALVFGSYGGLTFCWLTFIAGLLLGLVGWQRGRDVMRRQELLPEPN